MNDFGQFGQFSLNLLESNFILELNVNLLDIQLAPWLSEPSTLLIYKLALIVYCKNRDVLFEYHRAVVPFC